MLKKILAAILITLLAVVIWQKTPISTGVYYNRALKEYKAGNYEASVKLFEHILNNDKSNKNARFYYVRALSNLKPTYSVEKKIYEIANSDITDESKAYAKTLAFNIKKELLKGVEDNYIYNAISGKEIMRWDIKSFPLKVYIQADSSIPEYYAENIKKALNQWENRTGFIKFKQVTNKSEANIDILFKDFTGQCDQNSCKFAVGYTEPTISGHNLKQMTIIFHKMKPDNTEFTQLEVYNTALHEMGHALGIMGHSDNSNDVMYSNNDKTGDIYSEFRSDFQYLSMRDLKTLALLYKLSPTIINSNDFENESYYYSPLIIGNKDELLEKKLVEMQKYIETYPNFAAGHINIASVYSDMGNIDEALEHLNKAEELASNSDEKYLANYNRAIIYYNNQQYQTALKYANEAKSIRDNPEIDTLIAEINKFLN